MRCRFLLASVVLWLCSGFLSFLNPLTFVNNCTCPCRVIVEYSWREMLFNEMFIVKVGEEEVAEGFYRGRRVTSIQVFDATREEEISGWETEEDICTYSDPVEQNDRFRIVHGDAPGP